MLTFTVYTGSMTQSTTTVRSTNISIEIPRYKRFYAD